MLLIVECAAEVCNTFISDTGKKYMLYSLAAIKAFTIHCIHGHASVTCPIISCGQQESWLDSDCGTLLCRALLPGIRSDGPSAPTTPITAPEA